MNLFPFRDDYISERRQPVDHNLMLARQGDPAAFERLLTPYLAGLFGFIRKRVDRMAEDVYQETLLAAWRAIPGFKQEASIKTWLYAIAGYKCADALRHKSRQPQVTELEDAAPGPGFEEDSTRRLDIRDALDALPPEDRQLLYLVYGQGFTQGEAAGILQIPEGTVKSRLHRLRGTLQAHLEGGTP